MYKTWLQKNRKITESDSYFWKEEVHTKRMSTNLECPVVWMMKLRSLNHVAEKVQFLVWIQILQCRNTILGRGCSNGSLGPTYFLCFKRGCKFNTIYFLLVYSLLQEETPRVRHFQIHPVSRQVLISYRYFKKYLDFCRENLPVMNTLYEIQIQTFLF